MIDPITQIAVSALLKHVLSWLTNLKRAGEARKRESLNALNKVIVAVRKTSVYSRDRETGGADLTIEAELAVLWTELSFELQTLGLTKLAKKCDVKGRYWAAPESFTKEWLAQAEIGLETVEQLARRIKAEIQSKL